MNIVITGASRGIGFELAKKFAKDTSNKVFAIARNKEKLERLAKDIKTENPDSDFFFKSFDLNSGNIQQILLPCILEKISTIDILVNNAGFLVVRPFSELTDDDFDKTFSVNVKSVFKITR
ncbi:MAG TPA: SDR family NAD(P)-dependent oxidoreductase, partial [Bacteroidales bacterium]